MNFNELLHLIQSIQLRFCSVRILKSFY